MAGWLSRAIAACRAEVLGMAIADFTDAKLLHLPWEVMHDRTGASHFCNE
jgi:hypothetical protein